MKRSMVGVFNSINDAKNTLGQIKKESWNQTEFLVIVGEPVGNSENETETYYEMAGENFLTNPDPAPGRPISRRFWPGLREMELAGFGTVNVGFSNPPEGPKEPELDKIFGGENHRRFLEREIAAHKVLAFIEVEEEFLGKLRYIMDTHGAQLLESDF